MLIFMHYMLDEMNKRKKEAAPVSSASILTQRRESELMKAQARNNEINKLQGNGRKLIGELNRMMVS
ncbi:MAG: hypothetical protein FWF77_01705 [Defluviitaleaceae bacterium]|nr:hypothetical protein [Defluviitaleaceae bacterium]